MKRITILVTIIIAGYCIYPCSGKVPQIGNTLLSGKKRGTLSTAVFFLKVEDSIAFVEQYREFGGMLHLDLRDTLHLKDSFFVGDKTYVAVTPKEIRLKNLKEKLSWKLDVKLKECDEDGYSRYDVYKNRLLLDTLNVQNIPMSIYRPLVDKAYKLTHLEFKKELDELVKTYQTNKK